LRQQFLVSMKIAENRSRPWRSMKVLRRMFANLYNPLDDPRMDLWVGGMMSPRAREQDLEIIRGCFSQALEPFLDPA
jgi:hypothetical protein